MLRRFKGGREVREDFFDLKASLVLPDWPARFQESHFKYFLTSEVRTRVPAHLETGVYWLNLEDFKSFESAYKDWLGSHESNRSRDELAKSALRLYELLVQIRGGEYV